MLKPYDVHVHSTSSQDGRSEMCEYAERAIKEGAEALGFSEHFDYDYVVNDLAIPPIDEDLYRKKFLQLKAKYGDKIKLLYGAEFGYDKKAEKKIGEAVEKYHFDYVINSIHLIKGEDCYDPQFFVGKEQTKAYEDYLTAVYESLSASYDYQIVGHIGYIARYAPYETNRFIDYNFDKPLIDKILGKLIKLDKCLEINTSTKGLRLCVPELDVISRYVSLGGKLLSFGSDAHDFGRLFDKYAEVTSEVKKLGINELCYYENRELKFIKI